jgi:hypothetical protein
MYPERQGGTFLVRFKIIGITLIGLALLGSAWSALRHDQRTDPREAQIFQLATRVAVVEFRLQQLEENSK